MNNYNLKKGLIREKVNKFQTNKVYGVNVDNLFFNYILKFITYFKKYNFNLNILDLGTGTGIVPRTIYSKSNEKLSIHGIDVSKELISIAKSLDSKTNYSVIKTKLNSSKKYTIVTNRLCPRYKISDLSKNISLNGIYIFKEYDEYRGLKEIKDLFSKRWITRKYSSDFISELNKYNFKYIYLQKYLYFRKYTIDEMDSILKSTNIIQNYSEKDYIKIKKKLGVSFLITQDPYLIIASKNFNFLNKIL